MARKRRTKIGVIVGGNPGQGGTYQYELSVLQALIDRAPELSQHFTFAVFYQHREHLPLEELRQCGWSVHSAPSTSILVPVGKGVRRTRRAREVATSPSSNGAHGRTRPERALLRLFLRAHRIDLLLCPTPRSLGFETGVAFVMAIHDLQHRLQPEFPEVSAGGAWEQREYLYRNAAREATLLLADSEVGKEDILDCYGEVGATPEAISVLPFVAPPYLDHVPTKEAEEIRRRLGLPERFFFYPAQFWPHKNHVRIVEAIGLLKRERRLEVHVAFTGAPDDGILGETAARISEAAAQSGCSRQIHNVAFVSPREICALYERAEALVMPTFFGPTNIPILEAWQLGCPVLSSDIRGIREQVGDAGLLVDPTDVRAIADGIGRLATDELLRADLAQRGTSRVALYTQDDFARRLCEALQVAAAISEGR